MRVAILGSGSMGSTFGGYLALAGHDVTLVDVNREHMEAVARSGLELQRPDGTVLHAHPAATADPETLGEVELVIVLTKGFSTDEAARSIVGAVGAETWVATPQNGIGNDRRLASVFGPERVLPGTTTVGADYVRPGVVKVTQATAEGRSLTHFGAPRTTAQMPEGVRLVAATLTEAGLPTEAVPSADVAIWTKLAMAGPMNPLGAVLRSTVRGVWEHPDGQELVRGIFDEIVAVAAADGVELDGNAVWAHLSETYALSADHYPSMAADAIAGRRTEIDTHAGEVARIARERGVPAPWNEMLWRLVRAGEAPRG
jgi:2-dehydropantoate 2-reductase